MAPPLGNCGAGAPAASSYHSAPSGVYYDMAVATPDDSTTIPAQGTAADAKSAHDHAINSLSLERWRV